MNDAKATKDLTEEQKAKAEETKATADAKVAADKAAAKSAEDVAAIEAAHAEMTTAQDGRDIGDIPLNDPYWATLAAFQIAAAGKNVNFNVTPPVTRASGKEASPF